MPGQGAEHRRPRQGRLRAEAWRVRKDGSRFWAMVVIDPIVENGKLIGFAKITRDMTEQRAAQLAALESERRFRLLVQGVTDYAIYMLESGRTRHELESRRRAHQGLYAPRKSSASIFRASTPRRIIEAGLPAKALETARQRGTL